MVLKQTKKNKATYETGNLINIIHRKCVLNADYFTASRARIRHAFNTATYKTS